MSCEDKSTIVLHNGSSQPHPFDSLGSGEVELPIKILQVALPNMPLRSKSLNIQQPCKADMVPLDSRAFFKTLVNIDNSLEELPVHIEGAADIGELLEIEQLCLKHPAMAKEI
ncbi:cytochrome c oxidase subunit 1 [Diplodia intermedia]|uniref:Cytochrome c oxidase subunit 1 n=1 Tax=Diplodia intermedia TaxID=856260 RepID=A0ABR3TVF4_9PEZI